MARASCNNCAWINCKLKQFVDRTFGYTCDEWEHKDNIDLSNVDIAEPNYDNIRLGGLKASLYLRTLNMTNDETKKES